MWKHLLTNRGGEDDLVIMQQSNRNAKKDSGTQVSSKIKINCFIGCVSMIRETELAWPYIILYSTIVDMQVVKLCLEGSDRRGAMLSQRYVSITSI